MAKGNAWIAALLVTGGMCVSAAVVKHVSTPPPRLPDVTPPPSATGDANPADDKSWDDLTILIDNQHCDVGTLKTLAKQTDWYKVLQSDHTQNDFAIEQDRAAIAEYQKVNGDILVALQRRMQQGMSVIGQMQDRSRSKTMSTFVDLEHRLAAEETQRANAQKDELATLDKVLDLMAIHGERKMMAAETASLKTLYATLMQQQDAYDKVQDSTDTNTRLDYEGLDRLVGRIPNYSYSRQLTGTVTCDESTIRTFGLTGVEKKAQEVLTR